MTAEEYEQYTDVLAENTMLKKRIKPCKCDPVGSGEEYCNGGCMLRESIKELEDVIFRAKNVLVKLALYVTAKKTVRGLYDDGLVEKINELNDIFREAQ